jgi:hypothetical protein
LTTAGPPVLGPCAPRSTSTLRYLRSNVSGTRRPRRQCRILGKILLHNSDCIRIRPTDTSSLCLHYALRTFTFHD